jgi:hypothetical protein
MTRLSSSSGAVPMLTLVVLIWCTAGCGGSATPTTTSQGSQVVVLRWKAGFERWHDSVTRALNGISVLFSTQTSFVGLQGGNPRMDRALERYERVLAGCSDSISQLGTTPPAFRLARSYALRACVNLEQGEKLIEVADRQLRRGMPLNPIAPAAGPLSTGQSEATSAERAMRNAARRAP